MGLALSGDGSGEHRLRTACTLGLSAKRVGSQGSQPTRGSGMGALSWFLIMPAANVTSHWAASRWEEGCRAQTPHVVWSACV